jgi:hypothetical protein
MTETFTDFMVRCLEGQDEVTSATLILRRSDGTIGYRVFNQEVADTLGLMRVAALSVENDLVSGWKQE